MRLSEKQSGSFPPQRLPLSESSLVSRLRAYDSHMEREYIVDDHYLRLFIGANSTIEHARHLEDPDEIATQVDWAERQLVGIIDSLSIDNPLSIQAQTLRLFLPHMVYANAMDSEPTSKAHETIVGDALGSEYLYGAMAEIAAPGLSKYQQLQKAVYSDQFHQLDNTDKEALKRELSDLKGTLQEQSLLMLLAPHAIPSTYYDDALGHNRYSRTDAVYYVIGDDGSRTSYDVQVKSRTGYHDYTATVIDADDLGNHHKEDYYGKPQDMITLRKMIKHSRFRATDQEIADIANIRRRVTDKITSGQERIPVRHLPDARKGQAALAQLVAAMSKRNTEAS